MKKKIHDDLYILFNDISIQNMLDHVLFIEYENKDKIFLTSCIS